MKKVILVIIVVMLCCHINAQTIFSGTVYDQTTNQPISGVYVGFNATMANTVTDNSGKFELTVTNRLNTQLVFSHVAYQMIVIENPFDDFPKEIYMEPRANMLGDVVVRAEKVDLDDIDPFTRQQKLKAFREQFLGTTRAGKSCMIMNEGDIQLRYDSRTNTLYASSDNPIVVLNEYLGYLISFTLLDFKIEYSVARQNFTGNNTLIRDIMRQTSYVPLNSDDARLSYFAVVSSFTDISPNDARIKTRRNEIYEQSSTYFFKNIVNNTLEESNFRIYKGRTPTDQNLYFSIEDTLSLKMIRLIPDSGSIIDVRYRNRRSALNFYTDTLFVDTYGNIDQFDKVIFTGVMGEARAGDMLPLDFEP